MKMLLIGFITILMMSSVATSANKIEEISIYTVTGSIPDKGIIDAPIMVKNAERIGAIQLNLRYDPNILTVDEVTEGTIEGELSFLIDNTGGKVTIDINIPDGISGNGSIAKIRFNSIDTKGLSSHLNIDIIKIIDLEGGEVKISKIANTTYTVGRSMIVSGSGGVSTETVQATSIQIETPIETPISTPAKREVGFEAVMLLMAIVIVVAIRKIK